MSADSCGSKRSTLDIEGKIAEWRERSLPSAPPDPAADASHAGRGEGEGARTALVLSGQDVVCALLPAHPAHPPHPAALIDDLKTRLPPAKDEDNESGIHESE
ncbi:hypothetical protein O0L34_g18031 [Tuta absoluta]|nr:hypothetical protein O0L34_g18031 [Tuta absoluta]